MLHHISSTDLTSEIDTRNFAAQLSKQLSGSQTLGLVGDLGAGKTTFVRYLVAELGIAAQVSSPSYVLSHEYRDSSHSIAVEHWDLYRLSQLPEELWEAPSKTVIRCIEWSDKFPEFERPLDWKIHFVLRVVGEKVEREAQLFSAQDRF